MRMTAGPPDTKMRVYRATVGDGATIHRPKCSPSRAKGVNGQQGCAPLSQTSAPPDVVPRVTRMVASSSSTLCATRPKTCADTAAPWSIRISAVAPSLCAKTARSRTFRLFSGCPAFHPEPVRVAVSIRLP